MEDLGRAIAPIPKKIVRFLPTEHVCLREE
jgi:hypothetical protein